MLPIRIVTAAIGPALHTADAVTTEARLLSIPARHAPSGTGHVLGDVRAVALDVRLPQRPETGPAAPRRAVAAAR